MTAFEVAAYAALFVVFWGVVLRLIHVYLENANKKRRIPKGYLGLRGKKTLFVCGTHRTFVRGPMIIDGARCGFCAYNLVTSGYSPPPNGKGGI